VLADSVIVVDEVHSFDRNLFSALKQFLKTFSVPVLCMTASLTEMRIQDLKERGLQVFPADPNQFAELKEAADMPRYQVRVLGGIEEAQAVVKRSLDSERRVLWVVNRLDPCQELAQRLGALCYHSRFKLEDRHKKQNEVIALFKQSEQRGFAVTTQVCEMSLDLDAQLLISETSPITSLIQRMGRCNRHAKPGDGKLGKVYLYRPGSIKPYRQEDLEGLDQFLKAIDGEIISQTGLQELLQQFGPREVDVEKYAAFLECGPWAVARENSLVEEQDWTVQAILDDDLGRYFELRRERKPIDGLIVPVPRGTAFQDRRVGRFLRVAPSSHYSPEYGFFRQPVERGK